MNIKVVIENEPNPDPRLIALAEQLYARIIATVAASIGGAITEFKLLRCLFPPTPMRASLTQKNPEARADAEGFARDILAAAVQSGRLVRQGDVIRLGSGDGGGRLVIEDNGRGR